MSSKIKTINELIGFDVFGFFSLIIGTKGSIKFVPKVRK